MSGTENAGRVALLMQSFLSFAIMAAVSLQALTIPAVKKHTATVIFVHVHMFFLAIHFN